MLEQDILIVDDNENYSMEIKKIIEMNYDDIQFNIEYVNDSSSELIKDKLFDIYFLDIDMPKVNGFECAKKIKKINEKAIIIFVSSHDDLVYKSFEFNPFYFVRKEHVERELELAVEYLVTKIKDNNKFIKVRKDNVIYPIKYKDIVYIENLRNHYKLTTTDQIYIVRGSFKTLAKLMDDERFSKCHSAFIINFFYFKYNEETDFFYNDAHIPISRRYKKECKRRYYDYLKNYKF